MTTMRYLRSCVDWPDNDVHTEGGLRDLIDASQVITRRTFLRRVDRDDLRKLERQLGYAGHPSQGLTMAADWHITYFRSQWHGQTVYGFSWSAIEHVFVPPDDHDTERPAVD